MWNPKVHHSVKKNIPLDPTLSHLTQSTTTHSFFQRYILIVSSHQHLQKSCLSSILNQLNNTFYEYKPPHSFIFSHLINTFCKPYQGPSLVISSNLLYTCSAFHHSHLFYTLKSLLKTPFLVISSASSISLLKGPSLVMPKKPL